MPVFMRAPVCFGGELAAATATTPAANAATKPATTDRRNAAHNSKTTLPLCEPPRGSSGAPRPRLVGSLRGNQLPVGIARGDLARERPDVRHFLDALGVARDHHAAPIARGGDQLAQELDGNVSRAVLPLRLDDIRRLDADEALVDLLAAPLAIGDGAGEAFVDVAAQQALERLAIALGESRDDDLVGGARALEEGIGIERRVGAHDLEKAVGDAGIAGGEPLDPPPHPGA